MLYLKYLFVRLLNIRDLDEQYDPMTPLHDPLCHKFAWPWAFYASVKEEKVWVAAAAAKVQGKQRPDEPRTRFVHTLFDFTRFKIILVIKGHQS